jgi:hypothetical protein
MSGGISFISSESTDESSSSCAKAILFNCSFMYPNIKKSHRPHPDYQRDAPFS